MALISLLFFAADPEIGDLRAARLAQRL